MRQTHDWLTDMGTSTCASGLGLGLGLGLALGGLGLVLVSIPAYTAMQDGTVCSETSAHKIQTQWNRPKEE
jgi:hypothetical protein